MVKLQKATPSSLTQSPQVIKIQAADGVSAILKRVRIRLAQKGQAFCEYSLLLVMDKVFQLVTESQFSSPVLKTLGCHSSLTFMDPSSFSLLYCGPGPSPTYGTLYHVPLLD